MGKPPSFNIPAVEKRRDRIMEMSMVSRIGQPVDIDAITAALLRALPAGIASDAVFESARYLAGRALDKRDALRLSWRLAGNIKKLRKGQPVAPWTVQQEDEWLPLQILRCTRMRNSKDRIGCEFQFRVLAGASCPLKIRAFWTNRVIRMVASKIGFSRPWDKYPFKDPTELVGLRLLGFVEAARSRALPEFHEIECPTSMRTRNRNTVLKLRLRVDTKCPQNFIHACNVCAVGYVQCPAGTHYDSYALGNCNNCGKSAAFDPGDSSPYCVLCASQIRLRKIT